MVIPTVDSIPTAAIPTPYNPEKFVESPMMAAITNNGITTDCIPTLKPVIITVAGPVSPDLAIFPTGEDSVEPPV